jgi:transposase
VDQWVARYRGGGLSALRPRKAKGRTPGLTPEQGQAFKARVLAGPAEADGGVCRLGGSDARRILSQEFGKQMTLGAVYKLMHRLGLSCLRPRPRHRKNDPKAAEQWLERAPLLPGS